MTNLTVIYYRCISECNAENQVVPAPSVDDCLRDCEWVNSLFPQLLQIFQIFKGTGVVVKVFVFLITSNTKDGISAN